jgi:uncharacterized protein
MGINPCRLEQEERSMIFSEAYSMIGRLLRRFDTFGLCDGTIKTASGKYISLFEPKLEEIDIESIAQGLSNACRFAGQCAFYSVAEHSMLAARLAEECGEKPAAVRAILMHDATEGYLGDMTRPLKQRMREYRKVEKKLGDAIDRKWDLGLEKHHDTIKYYDNQMLMIEKKHLFPDDNRNWFGGSKVFNDANLLMLESGVARDAFMHKAASYGVI